MHHTSGQVIEIVRSLRSAQQDIIFYQVAVHVFHFFTGQLQIHAAHGIYQIRKCLKIHQHIAADMNVKILLDGLHQQLRAAVGICRIQTIILMSRYLYIHVTEQRCHIYLFRLVADRQQDHGIGSAILPVLTGIVTDQENICNSFFLHGRACHGFDLFIIHLGIDLAHQDVQPCCQKYEDQRHCDQEALEAGFFLFSAAPGFLFVSFSALLIRFRVYLLTLPCFSSGAIFFSMIFVVLVFVRIVLPSATPRSIGCRLSATICITVTTVTTITIL